MTKFGYMVFLALVLTALLFFIRLVIETYKEGEGTQDKREANMEHYVEEALE